MTPRICSETARERELFKYYQPIYVAPDPTGLKRVPRSSWDTALTAFAQLGALRLNAKRCLISLVSRDTHYNIAEATRTISLQADDVHEEDDNLWIGVCTASKSHGICPHAVDIFTGAKDCGAEPHHNNHGENERVTHIVVNDLLKDKCARRKDKAIENPHLRFYATVPITTKAGFVIGAYSIIDDKPRDGINASELRFLKDMSATVMDHLAATRAKNQHYRAEKMVKGMGLFVEGGSSLREWWLRTGHEHSNQAIDKASTDAQTLNQKADVEFGVQDAIEGLNSSNLNNLSANTFVPRPRSKRPLHSESASVVSTVESDPSENILSTIPASKSSQGTSSILGNPATSNSTAANSSVSAEQLAPKTKPPSSSQNTVNGTNMPGSQLQEAMLSSDLKHTFARASNLIRESLSVCGALFLDASVGSFGGRSAEKGTMKDQAPSAFAHASTPCTTSSSDEEKAWNRRGVAAEINEKASMTSLPPVQVKTCGILGYSTHTRSSLNMHTASEMYSSVPESFLRKLLKRYPHGKIFNLDADGAVSSSDEEAALLKEASILQRNKQNSPTRKAKRKRLSKEAEFKTILEILPGARSIAFFPLWDTHKERWFAGGFLWSTQPVRVLIPEEELTYFAAFGNSIMAEVGRLEALVAAQMKVNFISSISHELRSPLHGVLASVELLQDSNIDTVQADMVNMIEACGKTLLDTINHVLDFTKVNSKSKEKARKLRKSGATRGSIEDLDKKTTLESENASTTIADLSVITEEVIGSVYAGHYHRNPSSKAKKPDLTREPSDTSQMSDKSSTNGLVKSEKLPVMIIVDISHRDNYKFPIEGGAWRRILMNLFGNALKYTSAGFVRISLQTKDEVSKTGEHISLVTLSVSDSGQGISSEYLQHHLYTPFAQESSLSVGTGLGLSIVRQIVDDLGGNIDFNSEKGMGTEAIISLPIATPLISMEPSSPPVDNDVEIARNYIRGAKACLVAFDVSPDMDDTSGILSTEAKRMFSLKSSLSSILKDWFNMEVIYSPSLGLHLADISIILESDFNDLLANGYFENDNQVLESSSPSQLPCLLVLSAPGSEIVERKVGSYMVIKLQLPVGPRRMANVLSRCFKKRENFWDFVDKNSSPISPRTSSHIAAIPQPKSPRPSHTPSLSQSSLPSRSRTNSLQESEISVSSNRDQNSEPDASLPNVLLVEDNEINLKLLVTYMQRLRVPHAMASNGLEALTAYQESERPFDVVLMDISMPVMDGLTASREIRRFERLHSRVPATIIALTGAASPAARQEAFSSGIDRYLTKPVPMKALKTILDNFKL